MGTLMNVGGAAGGVGLPLALRETVDTDADGVQRRLIDQLGSYGTPSALTGIGGGLLGLGLYGANRADLIDAVGDEAASAAATYGVTSLGVGAFSGFRPAGTAPTTQDFRERTVQRSRVNGEQMPSDEGSANGGQSGNLAV